MKPTICVFGDSISFGVGDKKKGGWVGRLNKFLKEKKINVINSSVSGDNSGDLLKRIKKKCEEIRPDIIIIAIGENDSVKNPNVNVPVKEFKRNLEKIAKTAKEFASNVVFLGTMIVDESKTSPVSWDKTVSYTNKNLKDYDKAIKEVAKKEKVKYLKMSKVLNKKNLEDGLHPNSLGHKKIFLKVKEFLFQKSLLEQ